MKKGSSSSSAGSIMLFTPYNLLDSLPLLGLQELLLRLYSSSDALNSSTLTSGMLLLERMAAWG
jgi:hypothetical protein